MVAYFGKILVIVILITSSATTLLRPQDSILFFGIYEGNSNGVEENSDFVSKSPVQNYQLLNLDYLQISEFFKSTNSALALINQILKNLEVRMSLLEQHVIINSKANLSGEVQSIKPEVADRSSDEYKAMDNTTENASFNVSSYGIYETKNQNKSFPSKEIGKTKITGVISMPFSAMGFRRFLTSGANNVLFEGSPYESTEIKIPQESFSSEKSVSSITKACENDQILDETLNGPTTESTAAAIIYDYGLVLKIGNKLDSNLMDPELFLYEGLLQRKIPNCIQYNTTKIFSFKPEIGKLLNGVMLYRVGNTGFSLHLYFSTSEGRIAFGLLENSAPVAAIWVVDSGCSTGISSSFRCIDDSRAWTGGKVFSISQDGVYANLTGYKIGHISMCPYCQYGNFNSRIEIFKFTP